MIFESTKIYCIVITKAKEGKKMHTIKEFAFRHKMIRKYVICISSSHIGFYAPPSAKLRHEGEYVARITEVN